MRFQALARQRAAFTRALAQLPGIARDIVLRVKAIRAWRITVRASATAEMLASQNRRICTRQLRISHGVPQRTAHCEHVQIATLMPAWRIGKRLHAWRNISLFRIANFNAVQRPCFGDAPAEWICVLRDTYK